MNANCECIASFFSSPPAAPACASAFRWLSMSVRVCDFCLSHASERGDEHFYFACKHSLFVLRVLLPAVEQSNLLEVFCAACTNTCIWIVHFWRRISNEWLLIRSSKPDKSTKSSQTNFYSISHKRANRQHCTFRCEYHQMRRMRIIWPSNGNRSE